MNIAKLLTEYYPNAQWTLNGEEYSGLVWLDEPDTKPTQDRLAELWQEYQVIATKVKSVTMRSLRLVLIDLGLYQYTLAAINGTPDETERLKAQVWWESSPVVFRDNPYVVNIGAVLGKSEIEIDQIFSAAKLLDIP